MQYQSLTKAQKKLYDDTVSTTHHRAVELLVFRRSDGRPMFSLTNRFLGGSIQGDTARDPVTWMECELFDVDYDLDWTHGRHRRFGVEIVDSRFVPDLNDWVEETVFTGPLWDFERQGSTVSLVAEGPELNAMGSVRQAEHWPARTKATKVIRELLTSAGALARDLRIPNLRAPLPRDVTVGVDRGKKKDDEKKKKPKRRELRVNREDTYWAAADEIAEALDRDLFGDNRGRFLLRKPMEQPVYSFTDRTLLAPAKEKRGSEGEVPNTWIILGANPEGPRERVHERVELPRGHNLSAHALRWNDTNRPVIETIENKHLRTAKQARAVGERRRQRTLRELVEHEVEALPVIPWLRPGALVSIPVKGGRTNTRVRSWTLPLGPSADALTLGVSRQRGWRK